MPRRLLPLVVLLLIAAGARSAEKPDPAGIAFFEKKIRPVLVEQCYQCHSAEAVKNNKLRGGLQLDTRAGIHKGGDSGPAVVPGDPKKSLLLAAIRHDPDVSKMPPKGKLSDEVLADFVRWVEMGAPDPREGQVAAEKYKVDYEQARQRWAFQLPVRHDPPAVKDTTWPAGDIDRFVLANLEAQQLRPAPDASKAELLRRLHFDLTGLRPGPAEVRAFLAETATDAYEKVVDRLLQSPQFGERWGRHWLDIARYAEDSGVSTNRATWRYAFRYRDYVIRTFNEDIPYNRFVMEQIAGDDLPAQDEEDRARKQVAAGFLAMGVAASKEEYVDEQMDVLTRVFWGQTIGCARCHDHKFDPLSMDDHFAMQGIFLNTSTNARVQLPGFDSQQETALDAYASAVGDARGKLVRADEELTRMLEARKQAYDPDAPADVVLALFPPKDQNQLKVVRQWLDQRDTSRAKLAELLAGPAPALPALTHGASSEKKPRANLRELPDGKGGKAKVEQPRAVPRVLVHGTAPAISKDSVGRRELAEWAGSRTHPLTARAFVNRVWQHLLGVGIVASPDNFGATGEPPTHPELLDTLAVDFMDDGWSVKRLVRRIVLSRTYRMSSRHTDAASAAADPDNRWLWRARRRRLDAEAIRDGMLACSGRLGLRPLVGSLLTTSKNVPPNVLLRLDHEHRSVYLPALRESLHPSLAIFDVALPQTVVGRRDASNVPTQALYLLNNPFVLRQATGMAKRLLALPGEEAKRVEEAYLLAFGRLPRPDEVRRDLDFVADWIERPGDAPAERRRLDAWTYLCQAYLASAEYRYVD